MTTYTKEKIKTLLGEVPFTAELYWLLRQYGQPIQSRFSLKQLQSSLPEVTAQAEALRRTGVAGSAGSPSKKIFIFATLHYWIEHAAIMALALAAQGHDVTLGFLPYSDWQKVGNRFDLRRQNIYAKNVLQLAAPLVKPVSFLDERARYKMLSPALVRAVQEVTVYDTQYTLQVEDVDTHSGIYQLRQERNEEIARGSLNWMLENRPDVVIVPNGTIQELGVVNRVARHLEIPVVTYEFGEQRQRMWMAINGEVMRQDTSALWNSRQGLDLGDAQWERARSLMSARHNGASWENFARQWQDVPLRGSEQARADLGLDNRPVVMLATNVLGDSLTLGRNLFSRTMAEWISRTVQYFNEREDVQLIIRVHPGEVLTHGVAMADVVKNVLPKLPKHIHLIDPKSKINTYDIVDVADMGLVYTTTVGLEMAMQGLPVVVAGQTHYRGRGFTYDPETWVSYYKTLGMILDKPQKYRLSETQIKDAWRYAYYFFFTYPRPYPWHLVRMWDDVRDFPMKDVLSPEGMATYGETFRHLVGEPVNWSKIDD